jgi:hypothetical protein
MQLMKVGMCPWHWAPGARRCRVSNSTDSEAGQKRFQSAFSALLHHVPELLSAAANGWCCPVTEGQRVDDDWPDPNTRTGR